MSSPPSTSSTTSTPTKRQPSGQDDDDDSPRPHKMAKTDASCQTETVDAVSATVQFQVGGRSFVSRGIQLDPPDQERRLSAFEKLPAALISAIFEEACGEPDVGPLVGGKLPTALGATDESFKSYGEGTRRRATTIMSLARVCRRFQALAAPLMYTVGTLPFLQKGDDDQVEEASLSTIETMLTTELPKYDLGEANKSKESVEAKDAGATPASKPDTTPKPDPDDPSRSTIGSRLRTVVFRRDVTEYECLGTVVARAPNLTSLIFTSDTCGLSDQNLRDISRNVSPRLRRLCGLYLSRNGTTTIDNLLALINYAQELETLSIKNVTLSPSAAARLLFIFRLNARLRPTGLDTPRSSAGLTTLSFGNGSNISRVLLEDIHEAVPNLRHLHLGAGCLFSDEVLATHTGTSLEFDLTAFVSKVATKLYTLSLVCTSAMRVRGSLERIPSACPNLTAAHIRADQISFPFFQTIAAAGATSISPPSQSGSLGVIPGSDKPGSFASILQARRLQCSSQCGLSSGAQGTATPSATPRGLQYLRLHHSHSSSNPSDPGLYIELDSEDSIRTYAQMAVEAEKAGIGWPSNDSGSQRDLLMRLEWMAKARVAAASESSATDLDGVPNTSKAAKAAPAQGPSGDSTPSAEVGTMTTTTSTEETEMRVDDDA